MITRHCVKKDLNVADFVTKEVDAQQKGRCFSLLDCDDKTNEVASITEANHLKLTQDKDKVARTIT